MSAATLRALFIALVAVMHLCACGGCKHPIDSAQADAGDTTAGVDAHKAILGSVTIVPGTSGSLPNLPTATLSLGDFPASGSIGSAASTVDTNNFIEIAQTTSGPKALTLPSPTTTTNDRTIWITNTGSTEFTMNGAPIAPQSTQPATWTKAGAVWQIPFGRVPRVTHLPDFVANSSITGGVIDISDAILVNQATTGISLSLADPSFSLDGKIITITNIGSAGFVVSGFYVQPNATQQFIWNALSAEVLTSRWTPLTYAKPAVVVQTNMPAGGSYGTAATTVDVASVLQLNQTTALQSITLAGLTSHSFNEKPLYFANVGTQPITITGLGGPGLITVNPKTQITLTWGEAAQLWLPPVTPSLSTLRFSDVGINAIATRFLAINGAASATEAGLKYPIMFPTTFSTIQIDASAAPSGAHSTIYTLRKNGVDTALTITLSGASVTASATANVSFATGDFASVSEVPDGAGNVTADPRVTISGI